MKNIAVCLICTGKYDQFLPKVLKSIDKNFLKEHSVTVTVFTDNFQKIARDLLNNPLNLTRVGLEFRKIESLKFPLVTLLRYRTMLSAPGAFYGMDYIYYMDVDMEVVGEVGDEILAPLVAVGHPGYSVVGGGAWCIDENSTSYIGPMHRKRYVAGGFQGGEASVFLEAMRVMDENIKKDEERGVMATWHDESHWNKYIAYYKKDMRILDSSYCMVENMPQRKLWKISHLTPKIICLDKNHAELRS